MTRFLMIAAALICVSFPSYAGLSDDLNAMQTEWARIKYQLFNKDAKLAAIAKLEERATAVTAANPKSAEAKIWEAIILATDANITKSMSGLPKVEKAKGLLEQSMKINPRAMDGAADMTLGSLYFQVPGWPISFGSDKLAEQHFKKALAINPNNMDSNYWYGQFLYEQGQYAEAVRHLKIATETPIRKERPMADTGRQKEARDALQLALRKLNNKSKDNE